jgi:hypothetical protein
MEFWPLNISFAPARATAKNPIFVFQSLANVLSLTPLRLSKIDHSLISFCPKFRSENQEVTVHAPGSQATVVFERDTAVHTVWPVRTAWETLASVTVRNLDDGRLSLLKRW